MRKALPIECCFLVALMCVQQHLFTRPSHTQFTFLYTLSIALDGARSIGQYWSQHCSQYCSAALLTALVKALLIVLISCCSGDGDVSKNEFAVYFENALPKDPDQFNLAILQFGSVAQVSSNTIETLNSVQSRMQLTAIACDFVENFDQSRPAF